MWKRAFKSPISLFAGTESPSERPRSKHHDLRSPKLKHNSSSTADMTKNHGISRSKLEQSPDSQENAEAELSNLHALVEQLYEDKGQDVNFRKKVRECENLTQRLAECQKIVQSHRRDHKKLTDELTEKRKQVERQEDQLLQQQQSIEGWKDQSNSFAAQAQKLSDQLEEASVKAQLATAELKGFQLDALQQAQSGWTPAEDSQVRDALQGLYSKIRIWAKKYSAPSLRDPLLQHGPDFLGVLAQFPTLDSLLALKHPYLIVSALVSEHLRHGVFANPFFVLTHTQHDEEPPHCGYHLNDVYRKLLQGISSSRVMIRH